MVDDDAATGTCAVCVSKDGSRSLVANLAAANNYKVVQAEDHVCPAHIPTAPLRHLVAVPGYHARVCEYFADLERLCVSHAIS